MIKAAPLGELETRCDRRACERSQGRAAAGPREMVDSEIKLSVPKVEILDVILRDRPPLFESASATETLILFFNTKFEISRDVHGYVAVGRMCRRSTRSDCCSTGS